MTIKRHSSCPRCRRTHSGVCGIPPRRIVKPVTPGFTEPKARASRRSGTSDLLSDWVLGEARRRESEIIESLRILQRAGLTSSIMPEFDRLADQLDEVQEIIRRK